MTARNCPTIKEILMIHWGDERVFRLGDARVRMMPRVDTGDTWQPGGEPLVGTIDQVVLIDARGTQADALEADVRQRFVGRPYSDWA